MSLHHEKLWHALRGAALIVVICLTSCTLLQAQTTSASVSGTVVDAQGGVLPGTTVTLTSETQGTALEVITDDRGSFYFAYVRPDAYTLKISMQGFQTLQRNKLVVNANDRLAAGNFTLQVGEINETVTVTDESAIIQTRSGERAYTLESAAIQNIGVNGRSFFGLASLVPGVVPTSDTPTQVSNFNVNGQRANSNNFTVDGVANIDTGDNGGNMATINLDSVSEFKVLTSSYQAEYGRALGAQVQAVTKSGSKDFHGSAYWYLRRSGWNANSWMNNRSGIRKSYSKRNDFGWTFGGPVYIPGFFNKDKSKLFFFFNQEWQRRKDPVGEQRVTVPTALERKGDFSQTVDNNNNPYPYIRDYTLNLPCSSSNTAGCFKDGGVLGRIPANRLYAPTLAVLSIYPDPNITGKTGYNYTSQTPASQPHREELLRIDYAMSDNWRLAGRYMQRSEVFDLPYGISGWSIGGNLDTMSVVQKTPGRNFMVNTTGVLSNTTSLEISFGQAHNSLDHYSTSDKLTRSGTGMKDLPMLFPEAIQLDLIPRFYFDGGRIGNAPLMRTGQAPFTNFNTTYDALANLTKIMGSHATKFGVYVQRSLKDQSAFANFNGEIRFNNSSSNPYDSTHPFSNAALGIFDSLNQASAFLKPQWRYSNIEWYLQDNWRATSRLTLDYGLRFYFLTPQWDKSMKASNWIADDFDPSKAVRLFKPAIIDGKKVGLDATTGQTVNAAFIGRVVPNSGDRFNGAHQAGQGISDTLTDGNKFKISPRLGAAVDLTGKQNLVLRGAFAVLYDRPQGNQVFDLVNNPPGTQTPTLNWGLVKDILGTTPLYSPLGIQANTYEWKLPTVYQWNVGLQWKLPQEMSLDVAYVGSKSENLLQFRNLNAIPYGTTYQAANQDPTKGTCAGCTAPGALPGQNALSSEFLRTYQGFNDVRLWEFEAYSDYKALQTTISRRFAKDLSGSFNYTRSSAKGTLGGDWDYARIDGKDREANYGPLSFDRPHVFTGYFLYQTPKLTSGVLSYIVDSWQLTGNYRWSSGGPASAGFSIPGVANTTLTGSYTEGARIVLKGDPGKGYNSDDPYHQFNIDAFTAPRVGSIGLDSPRVYFWNPPTNNLDLSLSKVFPIGEDRKGLEIRADAFNALNHTQYSGVNRTINYKSYDDLTVMNLPFKADGSINNINGVGTVNGTRSPRTLQLVLRFTF